MTQTPTDAEAKPGPTLATEICVTRSPDGKFSLTINGEEFPYHVEDYVTTTISAGNLPSISVRIPTENLIVEDRPVAAVTPSRRG